MAYTPHQRGIIKRYYEHREDLSMQKLTEIVSNLYLADSDKEKNRLWPQVERALTALDTPKGRIRAIVDNRDLTALASLVEGKF